MRIIWLLAARRDLQSIAAYYRKAAGKAVADRMSQRIARSAMLLADHPHLGHPADSADGVHEWQVPQLPYLLPYRVRGDAIEILRVFHESQEKPDAW
jgi:plasmid stabilization system protein ParE